MVNEWHVFIWIPIVLTAITESRSFKLGEDANRQKRTVKALENYMFEKIATEMLRHDPNLEDHYQIQEPVISIQLARKTAPGINPKLLLSSLIRSNPRILYIHAPKPTASLNIMKELHDSTKREREKLAPFIESLPEKSHLDTIHIKSQNKRKQSETLLQLQTDKYAMPYKSNGEIVHLISKFPSLPPIIRTDILQTQKPLVVTWPAMDATYGRLPPMYVDLPYDFNHQKAVAAEKIQKEGFKSDIKPISNALPVSLDYGVQSNTEIHLTDYEDAARSNYTQYEVTEENIEDIPPNRPFEFIHNRQNLGSEVLEIQEVDTLDNWRDILNVTEQNYRALESENSESGTVLPEESKKLLEILTELSRIEETTIPPVLNDIAIEKSLVNDSEIVNELTTNLDDAARTSKSISEITRSDFPTDLGNEKLFFSKEEILQITPRIIQKLKDGVLSEEDEKLLSTTFGEFWTTILDLSRSKDVDIKKNLMDILNIKVPDELTLVRSNRALREYVPQLETRVKEKRSKRQAYFNKSIHSKKLSQPRILRSLGPKGKHSRRQQNDFSILVNVRRRDNKRSKRSLNKTSESYQGLRKNNPKERNTASYYQGLGAGYLKLQHRPRRASDILTTVDYYDEPFDSRDIGPEIDYIIEDNKPSHEADIAELMHLDKIYQESN